MALDNFGKNFGLSLHKEESECSPSDIDWEGIPHPGDISTPIHKKETG